MTGPTKKRILFWGAPICVPNGENYLDEYHHSGNNFGNILIGHGVASVLSDCEYVFRSQLRSPDEADERCDHIVIPAANFLWKGFDFGYMADFIEATNLPVTIIGLGAQTHDRTRISEAHPNTLRLVKIIADRSPSLGVRGYYTAEVLAAHGILNVEVLGCPSLYTYLSPPEKIDPPTQDDLAGMVVNFSRRVSGHAFSQTALRAVENVLLKTALRLDLPFVAQDELDELELAFGKDGERSSKPVAAYFSGTKADVVIDYFRRQTRYFCKVGDWSAFVQLHTGTIGSRLHGNIISLINGKPGFVIAHDSRTLEVCALTGMPYLHINDVDPAAFSEEDLVEGLLSSDYGLFRSNMRWLFGKYRSFLEQHSLPHRLLAEPVNDRAGTSSMRNDKGGPD